MRNIFRRNRHRTAITVVMDMTVHATTATRGTVARRVGRSRAATVRPITVREAAAGILGMVALLATLFRAATARRIAAANGKSKNNFAALILDLAPVETHSSMLDCRTGMSERYENWARLLE
jgi:hypothetical protein